MKKKVKKKKYENRENIHKRIKTDSNFFLRLSNLFNKPREL